MKKINNKTLYALKSSSRKVMEDAFNMIYQEYVYLIFYVSLKIVKNNVVAEDITNETFMQFYLNKDRLNENKNLKYYLVYIAKNLSLNYIDKQQKETILAETIDIQSTSTNDFKSYLQKFKNFLNEETKSFLLGLLHNKKLLFQPKYGLLSFFTYTYYFFFEFLKPLFLLIEIILVLSFLFTSQLSWWIVLVLIFLFIFFPLWSYYYNYTSLKKLLKERKTEIDHVIIN